MKKISVFIHIITRNHAHYIEHCVQSIFNQKTPDTSLTLSVNILDNASTDNTTHIVREKFPEVSLENSTANIGFCGGQNRGVKKFLESEADYFLILNPDLSLDQNCIEQLTLTLQNYPSAWAVTPLLYRANEHLEPLEPLVTDAAGMTLTPSLRHFDILSGEKPAKKMAKLSKVFGGTGACLLMRRNAIEDLLLDVPEKNSALYTIYPELQENNEQRSPLFDEAFFAYREDADLSWRAQILGWDCVFCPEAIGWHVRNVLPEKRSALPPFINMLGVQNRYLLQFNNFSWIRDWRAIFPGIFLRNILVELGVFFIEQKSLPAFYRLIRLMPRSLSRRKKLFNAARKRKTFWRSERWLRKQYENIYEENRT